MVHRPLCFECGSGSGIYVDLGSEKSVDGKMYREPSGRCPVFGKFIALYQPKNDSKYKNDYLEYVPTETQSSAVGHPLPGGFQNSRVLGNGAKFSPMTKETLGSLKGCESKVVLYVRSDSFGDYVKGHILQSLVYGPQPRPQHVSHFSCSVVLTTENSPTSRVWGRS